MASVSEALNEADSILSGPDVSIQPGTALVDALSGGTKTVEAPAPHAMFATYLVSPAYYADTEEMILIKLSSAKGEPFYLLDLDKVAKPLVCGTTEIFLAPYDDETACIDECEGMPALHLIPEDVAGKLFSKALQGVSTARWFAGLVFVSSVGVQFYYRSPQVGTSPVGEAEIVNLVYRVASNSAGHIEARDVRGAVTCDYPVPYFLIDHTVFAEATHTCAIVESLAAANASLIDNLCRMQYVTLHAAECQPDRLDSTLGGFMGSHSHLIRRLLEAQLSGESCDDAFLRRQRKTEIDKLVRLMMREAELVGELKRVVDELLYVQGAVEQCSAVATAPRKKSAGIAAIATVVDDNILLRPLITTRGDPSAACTSPPILSMRPSQQDADEEDEMISDAEDMIRTPMTECEPGIANSALLRSPSSSEEDM